MDGFSSVPKQSWLSVGSCPLTRKEAGRQERDDQLPAFYDQSHSTAQHHYYQGFHTRQTKTQEPCSSDLTCLSAVQLSSQGKHLWHSTGTDSGDPEGVIETKRGCETPGLSIGGKKKKGVFLVLCRNRVCSFLSVW